MSNNIFDSMFDPIEEKEPETCHLSDEARDAKVESMFSKIMEIFSRKAKNAEEIFEAGTVGSDVPLVSASVQHVTPAPSDQAFSLKEIRQKLNLSQKAFAQALKYTPGLICQIENGAKPSKKFLLRLKEFQDSRG